VSPDADRADIAIATGSGGTITLEPAGQIEYSGPPFEEIEVALADLDRVIGILEQSGSERAIELVASGYNSLLPESEHTLQVSKPRYLAMDRYFASIGPYGRRMMRSTCALQINLDFGTPAEAPGRWRLANMIAPSLNAIFANSPMTVDGRGYRSYRHEIWRHADPTRTGRLYDRPDLDPVDDYLRFALDAGVMLLRDEAGGVATPSNPMNFRQWISGIPGMRQPSLEDWRLHLSTLFPDVRARGYLEIRSIDALPKGLRDVAVAMVAALIYSKDLRLEAVARLECRQRESEAVEVEHGGCWRSDYQTGRELLELALPAIESPRLRGLASGYLASVLERGLTPGELVIGHR
jgi:glutamate--cysteine ligase